MTTRSQNEGGIQPRIAPASLLCHHATGAKLVSSSRDLGWTSMLIDHHRMTADDRVFETVPTPDQSIVVFLRGEQTIESYSSGYWRNATYHPGTIGLTPGGTVDRLRRRGGRGARPFEKANLYVPACMFDEAFEEFSVAGQPIRERRLNSLAFADPLLVQVALSLLNAVSSGASDLYAASTASWLAVHLLSVHDRRIDPVRLGPGNITDRRLQRVLEMMSTRLAERLELGELASEAGISKFHFVRVFRQKVGLTPYAMLVELRLDAARNMLAGTDLDVATIAGRCGFTRASQFTTSFSRRFGKPPARWRASLRGDEGRWKVPVE